jgi:hypothetical protein
MHNLNLKISIIRIILISFWLPKILFAQQSDCDLKRDTDGIKVYTCNEANESFKSLRAEFVLENAKMEDVKNFLWDVSNYVTWQYNMIEAERLSSSGTDEMSYRSEIDAPWPVENRELVVKVTMKREENMLKFFIKNTPYNKPPKEDVVRVPFFEASWKVVPDGTSLKVTYTLRIDPGGSVPPFLVNIAMAEGPYVSFKKLKEQFGK